MPDADPAAEAVAWIEVETGHAVALEGGKLVCRNAKGKRLRSVPKAVRDSDATEQLLALRDWLKEHAARCRETAETWMLRCLPVPARALVKAWPDPAWADAVRNAVVAPVGDHGAPDFDAAGFLREIDPERGAGTVDLDGESAWCDADRLVFPHPILLPELDGLRELASELDLEQGIPQLFRDVWPHPTPDASEEARVTEFADGRFEQLLHAVGRARTLGYRVRGGFATCPVWEAGRLVEGRFWIGAEHPEGETWTEDLVWVDESERLLPLSAVGPVAWSEGMRMASALFAGRAREKDEEA